MPLIPTHNPLTKPCQNPTASPPHSPPRPSRPSTAINDAIATIRTNLPFLLCLTMGERKTLAKLGDGRVAMLEDAHPPMLANPDLVPSYLDIAEVTKEALN